MDLDLTVRSVPGASVVEAIGDIDMQTAPALRDVLDAALADCPSRLVLDLQKVSFLDSSALGVMVGAQKRARAACGTIVVVAATDSVRRLFRITKLTELFPLFDSLDDALPS